MLRRDGLVHIRNTQLTREVEFFLEGQSDRQAIARILLNRKVQYRVQKSRPLVGVLRQVNTTTLFYFL